MAREIDYKEFESQTAIPLLVENFKFLKDTELKQ